MTRTRRQAVARARRAWRRGRGLPGAAPLMLVLSLIGCGSAEPKYYTLTASAGAPQGGGPLTVEVQGPDVAGYLKRDDIVLNNTGGQIHLASGAAWAEPLANAIARNLVLDLSQRLPGSNVYVTNGGFSPDAVVQVGISQFAEDDAGRAEVTATTSVHRRNATVADIKPFHAVTPVRDSSVGALAGALSQLVGRLADEVAKDLRTLGQARPMAAPGGRQS